MTTEDDFQAALDADPTDWQTRLVFADWLQDRDDPRAEGYRALGVLRLRTGDSPHYPCWWSHTECAGVPPERRYAQLPHYWFDQIAMSAKNTNLWWLDYTTRRAAEDAAAFAFLELPAARRAELLATVPA